jgi:hypothetical protein
MRDKMGNLLPFIRSPHFIKTFTSFGDDLVYPELYWYEGNYMFPYLEKIIEKEHPDLIIGYSAGGHIGFHLCNKYKIKGIHFNPAIASTSEAPTLQIATDEYKNLPIFDDQVMVIGDRDRKSMGGVDGHLVLDFLEKSNFNGEVLVIPELEHDVPINLFKMVFEYYRNEWWGNSNVVDQPTEESLVNA